MLDSRIAIGVLAVAGIALAVSSSLGDRAAEQTPPATATGAALPEGHPDISGATPAPGPGMATAEMSGVVRETIRAAGYSYVRLETDDGEIWVAGPEVELEEGAEIGIAGVMEMGTFESSALGRTFDPLYFTDRFIRGGEAAVGAYTGTVLQVIPAGRYVYVEVDPSGGDAEWLATESVPVAEGDRVAWPGGTTMRNFASSTLDRTFDEILFVTRLDVLPGS